MRWDFLIFIFSFLAIMVTDTAFRTSRLGKFIILEKILPGTSKDWPYHADLLIFCLKFKLSPLCEYLNYYYKITNDCWAIPEKSKQGRLKIYFLKKKPWIIEVCHLALGNYGQSFLYPWKFCKIVLHPLEIPRSKTKTHENAT